MSAASTALSMKQAGSYRAILWGGLIAGAMDITAAFVNNAFMGRTPIWVLQSIASGLLGRDSFKGGFRSACLGAVIHFFIAFTACSAYYAVSRKLDTLVNRAVVCGLLYGVTVYFFMYLIVLPAVFHRSFMHPLSAVVTGLVVHMLCVGLPISLTLRRYSRT